MTCTCGLGYALRLFDIVTTLGDRLVGMAWVFPSCWFTWEYVNRYSLGACGLGMKEIICPRLLHSLGIPNVYDPGYNQLARLDYEDDLGYAYDLGFCRSFQGFSEVLSTFSFGGNNKVMTNPEYFH
jgi:hypothetical protein